MEKNKLKNVRIIKYFQLILLGWIVITFSCTSERSSHEVGGLQFESSDPALNEAFDWAKNKALSYVRDGSDPVGLWYEAALPERDAFCMRDVSHQSLGAAMLGLTQHNKNMFYKFAESISESKDWCSFWEIDKYDSPAPVDYDSDDDFWYNLPANFDVVYNCYHQYLWTGDVSYLIDSTFLKFYEHSLTDFVDRWHLYSGEIKERNRFINQDKEKQKRFYSHRGIPTYNEGGRGVTKFGVDLSASLVAAYRAYGEICKLRGDEIRAEKFLNLAYSELNEMNRFWWDSDKNMYRSILYEDDTFDYFWVGEKQAFLHYLLYFDVVSQKERINQLIKDYSANYSKLIVELKTYLPMIFFSNDRADLATELMKYLCSPENQRRDYPENSFTVIEAFVRGLMGVEASAPERKITTISRLPKVDMWCEINFLPVMGREILIRHDGTEKTTMQLVKGSSFLWRALFERDVKMMFVNGKSWSAEKDTQGRSYVEIMIEPGKEVTVSVF